MNIGITGGTGFLGSYLIKYLLKNPNYKILALTRKPQDFYNENLIWQIGDLTSESDCKKLIANSDVLIHLAHNNSPLNSNDILSDSGLNLIPNLTLLESIKKTGKKLHLIYISTGGAIYGHTNNYQQLKETDICLPNSSYAIQKLTMENYIRLWADFSFLTATILRVSNPYGVLLPSERKQGLIGVALNTLLKTDTLKVYGNPENIRDYIHLEDMSKAVEKTFKPTKEFDIYNIGSGEGHSVNNILNYLEEFTRRKFKKEQINDENTQKLTDWNILNISKAKTELGWNPEIEFYNGLKTMCERIIQNKC